MEIVCTKCGKKLRVPDEHTGKQAKCPGCGTKFVIGGGAGSARAAGSAPKAGSAPRVASPQKPKPAAGAAPSQADSGDWHLQTGDGERFGPISKVELQAWIKDGRVDGECQVLCDGWEQWKWAEDVFPEISGGGEAAAENPFASLGDTPSQKASAASVNPFSSPQANTHGMQQHASKGGDGELSVGVVRALKGTRPWVLLISITMFIMVTLEFIGCLIALRFSPLSGMMGMVGVGMAGAMAYLVFNYQATIGAFVRNTNQTTLQRALESQKMLWTVWGIMLVIALCMGILFSIAVFALGAFAASQIGGM